MQYPQGQPALQPGQQAPWLQVQPQQPWSAAQQTAQIQPQGQMQTQQSFVQTQAPLQLQPSQTQHSQFPSQVHMQQSGHFQPGGSSIQQVSEQQPITWQAVGSHASASSAPESSSGTAVYQYFATTYANAETMQQPGTPWSQHQGPPAQPQKAATQQPWTTQLQPHSTTLGTSMAAWPYSNPLYSQTTPQAYYMPTGQPSAQVKTWVGVVTQLIPPNYGIVDGEAFYVDGIVQGRTPQLGDRVKCEAIPNSDGGQYMWRCTRVELEAPTLPAAAQAAAVLVSVTPALSSTKLAARLAKGPIIIKPNMPAGAVKSASAGGAGTAPSTDGVLKKEQAQSFNAAPPPTVSYTADMALAVAANAVESTGASVQQAPLQLTDRAKAVYRKPATNLNEEEKKRSEAALQSLAQLGDPSGIGAKLLGKMGFGSSGQAGLGRNEQGIVAPLDPKAVRGSQGLGFEQREARPRLQDARSRTRRGGHRGDYDRSPRGRSPSWSRSRSRSASHSRSRSRSPHGWHACKPPRFHTYERVRGLASVSKRYKELYIPSDFCRLDCHWLDWLEGQHVLPVTHPVSINIKSAKETSQVGNVAAPSTPVELHATGSMVSPLSEADKAACKKWSAKVILYTGISTDKLYAQDPKMFQHPVQKMQFMVGQRGKGETFLIGGCWDPIDGATPDEDPSVLIRTAARTFKNATGIDLSDCTQWIKHAELSYLRTSRKETYIERAALFLVDAWSMAHTSTAMLQSLATAQAAPAQEERARAAAEQANRAVKEAQEHLDAATAAHTAAMVAAGAPVAGDMSLDAGSLTVAQLQEELSRRGVDSKWDPLKGKKVLVDRLQVRHRHAQRQAHAQQQQSEQHQHHSKAQQHIKAQAQLLQEHLENQRAQCTSLEWDDEQLSEARAALDIAHGAAQQAQAALDAAKAASREAQQLLRDPPCTEVLDIAVSAELHKAKSSIVLKTLEQLLDYNEDDTKESMFEVSVFAELFRELLITHYGRAILRTLPLLTHKGSGPEGHSAQAHSVADKTSGKPESQSHDKVVQGMNNGVTLVTEKKGGHTECEDLPSAMAADQQQRNAGDHAADQAEPGPQSSHTARAHEAAASSSTADVPRNSPAGPPGQNPNQSNGASAGSPGHDAPLADATRKRPADPDIPGTPATKHAKITDGAVGEPFILACRFFDQRCMGTLDSEDLEDILYMVSADLSRRRVQALVDAVSNKRGRFSYTEHADIRVPPKAEVPVTTHTGLTAEDKRAATTDAACEGGTTMDAPTIQTRLHASEVARREADLQCKKMEVQLVEARKSEASAQEAARLAEATASKQVAALQRELAEARSMLAAASTAQESLGPALTMALADLSAAQTKIQEAMQNAGYKPTTGIVKAQHASQS